MKQTKTLSKTSQQINDAIDIRKFLLNQLPQALHIIRNHDYNSVAKPRIIGYTWELLTKHDKVSIDSISNAKTKIEESEYNEMIAPITSQWKLDMLFGRKIALNNIFEFIVEQIENRAGESNNGSNC